MKMLSKAIAIEPPFTPSPKNRNEKHKLPPQTTPLTKDTILLQDSATWHQRYDSTSRFGHVAPKIRFTSRSGHVVTPKIRFTSRFGHVAPKIQDTATWPVFSLKHNNPIGSTDPVKISTRREADFGESVLGICLAMKKF